MKKNIVLPLAIALALASPTNILAQESNLRPKTSIVVRDIAPHHGKLHYGDTDVTLGHIRIKNNSSEDIYLLEIPLRLVGSDANAAKYFGYFGEVLDSNGETVSQFMFRPPVDVTTKTFLRSATPILKGQSADFILRVDMMDELNSTWLNMEKRIPNLRIEVDPERMTELKLLGHSSGEFQNYILR